MTCKKVFPFEINVTSLAKVCDVTAEQQARHIVEQAERKAILNAYARLQYLRNADKIKRRSKAYYYRVKDTPEYKAKMHAYYLAHKDYFNAKSAERARAYPERTCAIKLKSYHKNKDKYRERKREYDRAHHAHKIELQRQRRANMTPEQRAEYNRKQNEVHRERREQYNRARREKRRQLREQAQQCKDELHTSANNAEVSLQTS